MKRILMKRILSCVLAVASIAAIASAQRIDADRTHPVTAPLRDAGVYDLRTGRFTPRSQAASSSAQWTVFNNTCTWTGGGTYAGADFCDDLYDEGRVPSSGPMGAAPTYNANTWEVAYCTGAITGTVDVDWEFFDTNALGGVCLGGVVGPPAFSQGLVGFDSSAAGFPLPGATSAGALGCWIVTFTTTTPICMNGGATSADLFNWRFRNNNTLAQTAGLASGPLVSGEPSIGAGSGTFNIPPGIDPVFGNTCGHGLDAADSYWINVDNTPIGGAPPAGCIGSPLGGTNCYTFGGYPAHAFASFYFRMEAFSPGGCDCFLGATYCTAKVNSLGCTPVLSHQGCIKVGTPSGGLITASNLIGNKSGLFFYGTHGLQGVPFQGGFFRSRADSCASSRRPVACLCRTPAARARVAAVRSRSTSMPGSSRASIRTCSPARSSACRPGRAIRPIRSRRI
jgi:hypothetical protein